MPPINNQFMGQLPLNLRPASQRQFVNPFGGSSQQNSQNFQQMMNNFGSGISDFFSTPLPANAPNTSPSTPLGPGWANPVGNPAGGSTFTPPASPPPAQSATAAPFQPPGSPAAPPAVGELASLIGSSSPMGSPFGGASNFMALGSGGGGGSPSQSQGPLAPMTSNQLISDTFGPEIAATFPGAPAPGGQGANANAFLNQALSNNPYQGQQSPVETFQFSGAGPGTMGLAANLPQAQPSAYRQYLQATQGINTDLPDDVVASHMGMLTPPSGPSTQWWQNPYVTGPTSAPLSQTMQQLGQGFNQSLNSQTAQSGALGGIGLGMQSNQNQLTGLMGANGVPGSLQTSAQNAQTQAQAPAIAGYYGMAGSMLGQPGATLGGTLHQMNQQGITPPPGAMGPGVNPTGTPTVPQGLQNQVNPQQYGTLNDIFTSVVSAPGSGVTVGQNGQVNLQGLAPPQINQLIGNVASQALAQGVPVQALHAFLGQRFTPQVVTAWMQQTVGGFGGLWPSSPQAQGLSEYLNALNQAGANVTAPSNNPLAHIPFLRMFAS